jgi:hypothetical protein
MFGYMFKGLASATAKSPGYYGGNCRNRSTATLQSRATGLLGELGSEGTIESC